MLFFKIVVQYVVFMQKKTVPRFLEEPHVFVVPKAGLEPARRVTTLDFESSASANSATSARFVFASEQ